MTLSKQLMLLIALMFLAIFTLNFYQSIKNIRDYLEVESEIHAQDTATSLGLSLAPHIHDQDDTILETMINAIFDQGYYLEIALVSPGGKDLVRKSNPRTFEQVPAWFVELLPMETAAARSEISTGWTIGGTVHVTIHPGIGYLKLWQQAQRTLAWSAAAFVAFLVLLVFVVRLVLIPLRRIQALALAIGDGKFGRIDPLPWTTDIRNVAGAMNQMSGKIEGVIHNLNSRLEEVGKRLRVDPLTGLETRFTFETDMKQRFMADGKGFIFILRIDGLGEYAALRKPAEVDRFVMAFVESVREALAEQGLAGDFLYRIVGAEFVLIAECADRAAAAALCERLASGFAELGARYDKPDVAHIGGVPFDPAGTTASMVSAATEAYEQARLVGTNAYVLREDSGNARDLDDWRKLVGDIIERQRFEIDFGARAFLLAEGQTDTLVLEEAIARVLDHNGEPLPIGTFVSVAEGLGRIHDFDLAVVRMVVGYLGSAHVQHDVAVNLSLASIASNTFRSELHALLAANPGAVSHLVFSVTAYGAARDTGSFASFIEFVHRHGAKVILKRYESRFIPVERINEYRLDYIRLARIYTEGVAADPEKRRLVEAMKEVGDLLDIRIVAEGVAEEFDYRTVREIGLYAASR